MRLIQIYRDVFQIFLIFSLFVTQVQTTGTVNMILSLVILVLFIFSNLRNILLINNIKSMTRGFVSLMTFFTNMVFILVFMTFEFVRTDFITYLLFSSMIFFDLISLVVERKRKSKSKVTVVEFKKSPVTATKKTQEFEKTDDYFYSTTSGKTYHKIDCYQLKGKKNKKVFTSQSQAKKAGQKPCNICID